MPLAAGDKFEIVTYCRVAQQTALNVLMYRMSAVAGDAPTEQQIVTAFTAYIKPYYAAILSGECEFLGCSLRLATTKPFGGYYYSQNIAFGDFTAPVMAKQTTGIISWRTALGGRPGRGRSYIPFPAETANETPGIPRTDYMTSIDALAGKLRTTGAMVFQGADTLTLVLQVYHKQPHTFTDVTHYVTPRKWATQRRRGDYGRVNQPPPALA